MQKSRCDANTVVWMQEIRFDVCVAETAASGKVMVEKEGPNKTLIETEQAATPAEWMLRLMTAIRIFDSSKAMDHVTQTRCDADCTIESLKDNKSRLWHSPSAC